MTEEKNAAEIRAWTKAELRRARFEVSATVHHMLLLIAVTYVAVMCVSLWWVYTELIEHGQLQSGWHWLVLGAGLAAFWFAVFAVVFVWTQSAVSSIAHRRAIRRLG